MIMFIASGISLIAMIIVAFYISNTDRFSERAKAVILPNYVIAVAIILIMFTLSILDVLEV